ncbi:MAG TPA: NADP-dependent malic enzyme [Gemmatimonadales bacterium]|nr:NADP-dependent malic enzyme [Gemmatimonadales bacterium]
MSPPTDRSQDALRYHEEGRPGKIQVVPTKPTQNQRDLSLAYTPGVAEPCLRIRENPEDVYRYTARSNLIAVVSNGTAVLGLGNIGALAGKPVMEGKGVLFKIFADIDVFDLEINAQQPDDVVRFCQMLEPTVGGINLEDIKSPECFEIERRLSETLAIPVFHDDQHGTAIISGAALLNALEVTGRDITQVRAVFMGAGAAAIATAEHYVRLGVPREQVVLCDVHGLIHAGREGLDPYQARFAHELPYTTPAEAFAGADVFVGLSAGGTVSPAMIAAMAPRPIVFALANPTPEILPDEVRSVRPDAIIATGRTDFPNQVNNVLGFPFIFRGALDVRARAINEEMKMAATRALAALAKEDVPEAVLRAYGVEQLRFGPEYLIPKPFDPRVLLWVAPAVAWAAMTSGVAAQLLDLDEYRARLESRLSRGRAVMRTLSNRAGVDPQRVAMTDAQDPRIIRAARILADEGSVLPLLVGRRAEIDAAAANAGISLADIEVVDPEGHPRMQQYAEALWQRRQRRGVTLVEAQHRMHQPEYFGAMMVQQHDADALVLGQNLHYPRALRPALEAVGADPGEAVAGIYMMVFQQETLFFADTTVNIDPDATRLTEIAVAAAAFVQQLGIEPRIALLSFSNFGSVRHPSQAKVAEAVRRLHAGWPALKADGEMQADSAVVEQILRRRYPFNRMGGPANVLIFPDLNSANICYKLLGRLGGAQAIGPILIGMAAPIQILERDSDVDDIVNMAVMAAVDAQERARQARRPRPDHR